VTAAEYADKRGHSVAWMTAAERDALDSWARWNRHALEAAARVASWDAPEAPEAAEPPDYVPAEDPVNGDACWIADAYAEAAADYRAGR
jgi:hypothetical protein